MDAETINPIMNHDHNCDIPAWNVNQLIDHVLDHNFITGHMSKRYAY